MRSAIIVPGLIGVVLALPVAASGESAAVAQRGGDDYEISFTLKTFNGEPTELRRFRFKRLDTFCDGGAVVETRGRIRSIAVNDRNRFREVVRRDTKTIRVKGRVSGDLDTIRGRIRVRGDLDAAQNCDSGRVRWRAHQ